MRIHSLIAVAGLGIAFIATSARAADKAPFPDVPNDHYAADAVAQLAAQGIVQGNPDGTYGGGRAITRYEAAVALSRFQTRVNQVMEQAATRPGVPGPRGPQGRQGSVGQPGERGPSGPRGAAGPSADAGALHSMTEDVARMHSDVMGLRRSFESMRDELHRIHADVDETSKSLGTLDERLDNDKRALKYGPNFQHRGRGIPNNTRGTITDPLPR